MRRRIRFLTYNVHSCFGTDRKLDPARIAAVINECRADIIALQEVDVGRARSGGIDQAHMIAAHLQMEAQFHPALHLKDEKYGDALLTALPMRLVKAAALPSVGEARGALWVEVDLAEVKLQIVVTHLGLRGAERVRQVTTLLGPGWLGGIDQRETPVVLAGDLNATARSAAYGLVARQLRDAQLQTDAKPRPTFPSRLPLLRIDHIFVGAEIEVRHCGVHNTASARVASDHLPLVAELEIGVSEQVNDDTGSGD
ncbi:endonuclease/exonuclease/phosphatase family protein [Sinorhizobium mexicanum]|uniref:Endonuclease/exonuclease/phosphatase family protein n=1 Tax=Sinorhizobium mexicanum TaxID=375549 RepID=A0A859QQK0_9HYPH|nr:endonuclease/exonuclease/phosphatase family protein [Sinorhizobium mexicanum]MBP1884335.1 endonuclease/exonuclease/phosphatase family metal-dependent hydrolase [Sinorhizobium mexicanum]QLL65020.1 endonuclease/exonuclease/phosphatase family protein [Sinorhizobium mexicanum]